MNAFNESQKQLANQISDLMNKLGSEGLCLVTTDGSKLLLARIEDMNRAYLNGTSRKEQCDVDNPIPVEQIAWLDYDGESDPICFKLEHSEEENF